MVNNNCINRKQREICNIKNIQKCTDNKNCSWKDGRCDAATNEEFVAGESDHL